MSIPAPEDFHSIDISGIRITEPVTAGTDILITITAIFISYKLFAAERKTGHWIFFFFFMGLSTLAGAISHGLRYYLGETGYILAFSLMNIFSGMSTYSAQLATLKFCMNDNPAKLKAFFSILLFIFFASVLITQKFAITNIYVTATFLFVFFMHLRARKSLPGSNYIVYGIAFSFITAFVFLFKLSISDIWFNHKDISHVLIVISLMIMYKGASRIRQHHLSAND